MFVLLMLLVPAIGRAEETPEPEPTPLPTAPGPEEKGLSVESLTIEQGVILNIEIRAIHCQMAGYYFGVIPKEPAADNYDWVETQDRYLRLTKWPGSYYFWLRDTEGNTYGPTAVDLPTDYYNINFLHENQGYPKAAISTYLPEACGTTVEEVNAAIAENVAKAGAFTREGVIIGVMSHISLFQGMGLQIPFFHFGYWPFKETGWYLNPDWGTVYSNSKHDQDVYYGRVKADKEMGTNCSGFVHYAFRLAGLNTVYYNAEGNAGGIADFEKKNSSMRARPYYGLAGDVMTSRTDHEMLIMDKYDDNKDGLSDGYIVAESSYDTGGIGYNKMPFDTYSRFCDVWNMDGAYYNTGKQTKQMKYWFDYHAPRSSWPDFFAAAVDAYTRYQVVFVDEYGVNQKLAVAWGDTVEPPPVRNSLNAKVGHWDVDLSGVKIERNYVVTAVYTEEDGGLSWIEEISRTPEPTPEPTPTPTPPPTPPPSPTPPPPPEPQIPQVERIVTKEPAPTRAPESPAPATEAPLAVESADSGLTILLLGAGALALVVAVALVAAMSRRGRKKR